MYIVAMIELLLFIYMLSFYLFFVVIYFLKIVTSLLLPRGVSAIAAHLMRRVAKVDAVDIYGATPLHYAAKHNHADIVELVRC